MAKSFKSFLALAIIFTVAFGAWMTIRIVNSVSFSFNCSAYLKRAAAANTVETAKNELATAIDYIERSNLTEGVISVFFRNPANDIGFWYNNLKAAHAELDNLPQDATPLEKTNVLMKLRESLTDRNDGTNVVHPEGISVYPNNALYFWWCLISVTGLCVFWVLFGIAWDLALTAKRGEAALSRSNGGEGKG